MRRVGLAFLVILLAWLFVPSLAQTGWAREGQRAPHVLLLLVNHLDVADLASGAMPRLERWTQKSGVGLMNDNTGGEKSDGNALLTLALGAPVNTKRWPKVYDPLERADETERSAAEVFQMRTGLTAAGPVLINAQSLRQALQGQAYAVSLDASPGEKWAGRGLRTLVLGSGDEGETKKRFAAMFAMAQGQIPHGSLRVREVLSPAADRPFGLRMVAEKVVREAERGLAQYQVLIIDGEDLSRLDDYASLLTPQRYNALRRQILQETDVWLDALLQKADEKTLVLLVSPRVSRGAENRGEWLSPLLVRGGGMGVGLLTSATTRQRGIVTNLDVAPTLLQFFSLPLPSLWLGHPLSFQPESNPLAAVLTLSQKRAHLFLLRPRVLIPYGIAAIFLFCFYAWRLGRWALGTGQTRFAAGNLMQTWKEAAIYAILALPLLCLLQPCFAAVVRGLAPGAGKEIAGVCFVLLLIVFRLSSFYWRLVLLSWLLVGAVAVDALTGGRLAAEALFSYDPIVGARYYGVGNEYMGLTLGATLLSLGCLLEMYPQRGRGIFIGFVGLFVLLFYVFASPSLGANAGGALTTAATLAAIGVAWRGKGWRPRDWGMFGLSLFLATLLLLLLNRPEIPWHSHIAQAVRQIHDAGGGELLRIVGRKLVTHWRVSRWTVLGPLFILFLAFFSAVLLRKNRGTAWLQREYPGLHVMLMGAIGGAWAGLCLNDSGLVVALFMMLQVLIPAGHILLYRTGIGRQEEGEAGRGSVSGEIN